jgi:DNA-binding GntR family transcriptional regulator
MQSAVDSEGVPKYVQLARILRDKITSKEYGVGERIPTESALGETYRVSRITVRQAIDKLVRDSFLDRRQGLGTFVLPQKLRRNIAKVYSFTSDMVEMGLEPGSRVLSLAIEEADEQDARSLQLPAGNRRVTRLSRVRMANNAPILRETTLIPEYLCPGLVDRDFAKTSLYRVLTEERGLLPHHAEETYEAVVLSRQDAALLGCPQRGAQPAFAIQRLTYLENGIPVELTRSVGRGDRITLAISMTSAQADVRRRVEF